MQFLLCQSGQYFIYHRELNRRGEIFSRCFERVPVVHLGRRHAGMISKKHLQFPVFPVNAGVQTNHLYFPFDVTKKCLFKDGVLDSCLCLWYSEERLAKSQIIAKYKQG